MTKRQLKATIWAGVLLTIAVVLFVLCSNFGMPQFKPLEVLTLATTKFVFCLTGVFNGSLVGPELYIGISLIAILAFDVIWIILCIVRLKFSALITAAFVNAGFLFTLMIYYSFLTLDADGNLFLISSFQKITDENVPFLAVIFMGLSTLLAAVVLIIAIVNLIAGPFSTLGARKIKRKFIESGSKDDTLINYQKDDEFYRIPSSEEIQNDLK